MKLNPAFALISPMFLSILLGCSEPAVSCNTPLLNSETVMSSEQPFEQDDRELMEAYMREYMEFCHCDPYACEGDTEMARFIDSLRLRYHEIQSGEFSPNSGT